MTLRPMKRLFKYFFEKLDKLSPRPLFYQFVMSRNERVVFDRAIKKSTCYLEFGLGGSTLRAIQKSDTMIYSVESSPEWVNHMREYSIVRSCENKRLFIFPVDIGPTREWGLPAPGNSRILFPAYSANIFNLINKSNLDLVLVDGRFRVACTIKIVLECHANKNLTIMIHDFWNRKEYHVVLKYLNTIDKADAIGLFSIKKCVDLESARRDYEEYKFIVD
jgi:hypothetical protein